MKPEKVFKRYDIRGVYPEEINEEFAERLGKALGTFTARNYSEKIVVSKDNKETSQTLKEALIKGLRSTGVDVLDVGTGPTDFAAWSGMKNDCVSVQVTSSHMPLNFNGFKFMYPEGNGFVNEDLYEVQDLFREKDFNKGNGDLDLLDEMLERYKEELIEFSSKFLDNYENKVVFESMGGTSRIFPEIMEELGLKVIDISKEKNPYIDFPNPKPENLEHLKEKVEETDADLGLACDLDADRVTVYYKDRFLSGDEIFQILAQLVDSEIVASIDTSKGLEDFGKIEHTKVGDPFVMDKALEIDADLAGEPNGHYSFTDFVPYNSGMLAALILSGLDIEERLQELPDYHVSRDSVETENKEEVIEFLKKSIEEEQIISDLDGVKFQENKAEVLVRPSGSSPKVRIISESLDKESSEEALKSAAERISQF